MIKLQVNGKQPAGKGGNSQTEAVRQYTESLGGILGLIQWLDPS